MNMQTTICAGTSRRAFLSSLALAPCALAVPALAASPPAVALPMLAGASRLTMAIEASAAADRRFQQLDDNLELDDPAAFHREEEAMGAAYDRVRDQVPIDWTEFTALLAFFVDSEHSTGMDGQMAGRMLAHARRLSGAVA